MKSKHILVFFCLFLFSGCTNGIISIDLQELIGNNSIWSYEGNTTNIVYPRLENGTGNVTVRNYLFVGNGIRLGENSSISFNSTCLLLPSPDGSDVFEVCNNNSFHMVENNIRYVDINLQTGANFLVDIESNDTITAKFLAGDGSQITNLNLSGINVSDIIDELNLTTYWDSDDGINIYNKNSGNVTINNLTYPNVDGNDGDVLITDGNGTLTLSPFLLGDTADYVYNENETGGIINVVGIEVTLVNFTSNFTGGIYRSQFYTEGKTALANKEFTILLYIDDLLQASTTVRTALADSFVGVSAFKGGLNLTQGEHEVEVRAINDDNNLFTWQKSRVEVLKVAE